MFVVGNLFVALAKVIDLAINLYLLVLFVRVILSWIPGVSHYNPIVRFIYDITDPLLDYVRKKLKLYTTGFDITPIIVFFGLLFLKYFLVMTLYQLGFSILKQ